MINTLDPGLIIKTLQKIKKKKAEKEIKETPILITSFYQNMLMDFEAIGVDKK